MVAQPGPGKLTKEQREQISDARLLLESAAYNAAILAKVQGVLDPEQRQALENAAAQAAQAAGTLRRIVLAVKAD